MSSLPSVTLNNGRAPTSHGTTSAYAECHSREHLEELSVIEIARPGNHVVLEFVGLADLDIIQRDPATRTDSIGYVGTRRDHSKDGKIYCAAPTDSVALGAATSRGTRPMGMVGVQRRWRGTGGAVPRQWRAAAVVRTS